MERLCERPGCSDPASVAYGMRAEDLVFWLDRLDGAPSEAGVLCLRHANSMVVPRSWTLDDLRDPDLHLFRPPAAERAPRRARRAAPTSPGADIDGTEQLEFGVVGPGAAVVSAETPDADASDDATATVPADAVPADGVPADAAPGERAPTDNVAEADSAGSVGTTTETDDAGSADPESWSPSFDDDDDLGGLLSARSPLLARAFRGDDRPRT